LLRPINNYLLNNWEDISYQLFLKALIVHQTINNSLTIITQLTINNQIELKTGMAKELYHNQDEDE
jgi:hypothetical protein